MGSLQKVHRIEKFWKQEFTRMGSTWVRTSGGGIANGIHLDHRRDRDGEPCLKAAVIPCLSRDSTSFQDVGQE